MYSVSILTIGRPGRQDCDLLAQKLTGMGLTSRLFQGVRGDVLAAGDYFESLLRFSSDETLLISPGELACLRGHLGMMQALLDSTDDCMVILEDDAQVPDDFAERLMQVMPWLPQTGFMHLGGMQPMPWHAERCRVRCLSAEHEVYRVEPNSLKYLMGAVAYVVSREVADRFCQAFHSEINVIDDYARHRARGILETVLYVPLVRHPVSFDASLLESGRRRKRQLRLPASPPMPLWRRLWREVMATVNSRRGFDPADLVLPLGDGVMALPVEPLRLPTA